MPGVLPTLGSDGVMPPLWTSLIQQINGIARVASGAATNPSSQKLDSYQNTTFIQGALSQVVTIGAKFQQPGVQVGTALTGFGSASIQNFVQTTITVTAGSTAATVGSGAGLSNGMVIGAITASGIQAITPGTTFTISGTSVTLSAVAVQSGSGLYCCAANWVANNGVAHS